MTEIEVKDERYFDDELNEWVYKARKPEYGCCNLCTGAIAKPKKKFKYIWVCDDCLVDRLEDCLRLNKKYAELFEEE